MHWRPTLTPFVGDSEHRFQALFEDRFRENTVKRPFEYTLQKFEQMGLTDQLQHPNILAGLLTMHYLRVHA